jgi:hypothetical protein
VIRGIQYSRPLAAASIAAAVALCAMIGLHLELKAGILERRRRASVVEATLLSQINAKSMYGAESLEELRDKVGQFRVQLGSQGTWERLVGQLGEGWTAESGPMDNKGDYSIRFGTFRLISPSVLDWPKIVEAVKESEAIPGVGIAEFEMKASGDRDRRSLDLVRFLVAVQTSRNGKNAATLP